VRYQGSKHLIFTDILVLSKILKLAATGSLIAATLASCVGADVSLENLTPQALTASAGRETQPSTDSILAHLPTLATAAPFILLPSSTTIPTLTPVPTDLLPGYGFGPTAFPQEVDPLTGIRVVDRGVLERRPMVIKITNFPRSVRPQWGLSLADHVYEYFLEDELTRFVGVYYGQDASRVGPIRSARPFDEHILRAYKGVFAFAYADDRVIDLWKDSDIKNFLVIERPGNCPPMCRIGSEKDYNTLYTDTHLLSQYITERGTNNDRQNLDGLRFEDINLVIQGGGQVSHVEIRFSPSSYNYWEYDPISRRYLRWQDTERREEGEETYQPLFDRLTQEQIATDNLVVLLVPMSYFFQSNSTEIYNIDFLGKGDGYVLRNGKVFRIEWNRPARESMVSLTWPGGPAFPLKPGNIWFEVLSDFSTVKMNGSSWSFTFVLPVSP
jgi:Protein of unknown function (DUF3048) N-terminal domain/Protein of unknown function (DUF3048) C-terminal domain